MAKRLKNPLRPIAVYIDLTVIDPVKTATKVFRRRGRPSDGAAKRAKAIAPAELMDHGKFRRLQKARERAKEHQTIRELLDQMTPGRGDSTDSGSAVRKDKSQTTFRPVSGLPAVLTGNRNEDTDVRPALYLVKR